MLILIVDDDPSKVAAVEAVVRKTLIGRVVTVQVASSITSAKQRFREASFDFVILDIAIPRRDGEFPVRDGGILLLREVMGRGGFMQPKQVVGLTAYVDIYDNAGETFGSDLWTVVYYDRASEEWSSIIAAKLLQQVPSDLPQKATSPADVCFAVAVEAELEAVRQNGWSWTRFDVSGDGTMYYEASYKTQSGTVRRAVAARSTHMGMASACVLATKMGITFKPRTIVMTGICAGDSKEVRLGDLIIGNPVWYYGSGKHLGDGVASVFQPEPYQLGLSSALRAASERLVADKAILKAIHSSFSGSKPEEPGRALIGPLASGAAVVANRSMFEQVQKAQHRKLLGIEMEAYGVMCAADDLPTPQPRAIVLKGVSDFADSAKSDAFREYAAYVSAGAAVYLCEQQEI